MEQPKPKDPQRELEIAIGELEERVDRLRALYEQYFMGYEKIEPGVQRKDVDRRFAALRKQQIRNTALRFRFNVITQKFNTYSMYWARVCRQIEEGTFKRHVAKAARRFAERPGPKREQDISIEVEIGDFEDADLEALLAEVDAAADAYSRSDQPPDTVPPAVLTAPPPYRPTLIAGTQSPSATSFTIAGGREAAHGAPSSNVISPPSHLHDRPRPDAVDESLHAGSEEAEEAAQDALRFVRQAAPPPAPKPRIVVRRRIDGEAPPSSLQARPPVSANVQVRPPMSQARPTPESSPQPRPRVTTHRAGGPPSAIGPASTPGPTPSRTPAPPVRPAVRPVTPNAGPASLPRTPSLEPASPDAEQARPKPPPPLPGQSKKST